MSYIRHNFCKLWLVFIVFLIASAAAMLPISGCIKNEADVHHDKKIIITSIITTAYFAERIAGEKAEVISLIPPGASPHSYEPTPGQLETVSRADLFVKVGSGIEFELEWVDKIINMNKEMKVADCSSGIELIKITEPDDDGDEVESDYEHHGTDPHIWLSPDNAKVMANNIYESLVLIDSGNEGYYYGNLKNLLADLDSLEGLIREMTEGYINKKILVFHPAWTYFVREYGLEQIAVEEEGKEPTLGSMEALVRQARQLDIKVIFASPEFNTKSAEVVASEIGGEVVLISPLPQDYIADMEEAARAFGAGMLK